MTNLDRQMEMLRRRRWLVVGMAVAGLAVALVLALRGGTTHTATATLVVGSASTQNPSGRAPEQDAELARGYIQIINNPSQQGQLRDRAEIGDAVTIAARPVANSPFIDLDATAPDSDQAIDAAAAFAEAFVEDTESAFSDLVTSRLAPLRARAVELNAEIAANQRALREGGLEQEEIDRIEGELAGQRAELEGLSEQLGQQAAAAGNPNLAGIYRAPTQTTASSPSVVRNGMMGLIGGLIVGVGAALALGALGLRLHSPSDVRERLGLDTLATLPRPQTRPRGGDRPSPETQPPDLRTLAERLAAMRPAPTSVALVPADGAAAAQRLALGLARERATMGDRVILIPAGAIATPTTAKGRGRGSRRAGPSAAPDAGGTSGLESLLRSTDTPGLRILPADAGLTDRRTLLGTDHLREVVIAAERLADLVVVEVADGEGSAEDRLRARAAGVVVLVIDAAATSPSAASRTQAALEAEGVRVVGAVLAQTTDTSILP